MAFSILEINSIIMIYLFSFAGIGFAGFCTYKVLQVKPKSLRRKDEENQVSLINESEELINGVDVSQQKIEEMENISKLIAKGADVFLFTEYLYLLVFVSIMALLIFFFGEIRQWTFYTTISFICGALTSMLCGYLGMKIAVNSNWRTTFSAL
jgi:hypothetical protein